MNNIRTIFKQVVTNYYIRNLLMPFLISVFAGFVSLNWISDHWPWPLIIALGIYSLVITAAFINYHIRRNSFVSEKDKEILLNLVQNLNLDFVDESLRAHSRSYEREHILAFVNFCREVESLRNSLKSKRAQQEVQMVYLSLTEFLEVSVANIFPNRNNSDFYEVPREWTEDRQREAFKGLEQKGKSAYSQIEKLVHYLKSIEVL